MAGPNEDYQKFCKVVQDYCSAEHKVSTGDPSYLSAAAQVEEMFKRATPTLATKLGDAPTAVYARFIIDYAVKTLENDVISVIWRKYYLEGATAEIVAIELNYSPETVRHHIADFPEEVVKHLWIIDLEISAPLITTPRTWHRRAIKILEDNFDLSRAQANALLAFCYGHNFNLSRNAIAKEVLCRSRNTIKTHLSRVYDRLRVKDLKEARNKALAVLEEHLGADWVEFYEKLTLDELKRLYLEHVF